MLKNNSDKGLYGFIAAPASPTTFAYISSATGLYILSVIGSDIISLKVPQSRYFNLKILSLDFLGG
uniref:Uncharacterized protein n=1 Tax=Virus NIOZ-UU159 TaxID=2763270 RepID=A0A7S9XHG8_9VIRU|nr:MAG: hypothetical protein NIOZUU159_00076 [Virus NIOZ-UU159]